MRNVHDMRQAELLTVKQAAAELSITGRAVLHRIAAGTLAAEKIGEGRTNAYVIERAEVERAKAEASAA